LRFRPRVTKNAPRCSGKKGKKKKPEKKSPRQKNPKVLQSAPKKMVQTQKPKKKPKGLNSKPTWKKNITVGGGNFLECV